MAGPILKELDELYPALVLESHFDVLVPDRPTIGAVRRRHTVVQDAEPSATTAPDGLHLTDVGNAQRFVNLAGGTVRYVHGWGRWMVYRSGRWVIDTNDALVTEKAKVVPRRLLAMVPKLEDPQRSLVFAAGRRAESAGALSAMVKLARGIPDVLVNHEELDANPDILNCTNGTVDLVTGTLRPHDPAELCTMQCPFDYDPTATAPLWESCLERWQPDPEMREYLQREAGADRDRPPDRDAQRPDRTGSERQVEVHRRHTEHPRSLRCGAPPIFAGCRTP